MATSPRRTRSSSRHSLFDAHTISAIPIMKVTSMEPYASSPSVSKRARHKVTDYQLQRLEELYQADSHPSRGTKEALAREVGMSAKSVLIWFQNRRQDRSKKGRGAAAPALTRKVVETRSSKPRSKKTRPSVDNAAARAKKASKGLPSPSLTPMLDPSETTLATPHRIQLVELRTPPSPLGRAFNHKTLCEPSLAAFSRPSRSLSSNSNTLYSADRSPELWRILPPTPTDRNESFSRRSPSQNECPLQPLRNASNFAPSRGFTTARPQKPSLEWACANSASRRRHGLFIYQDEDDSAGESCEFDPDLTDETVAKLEAADNGRVLREVAIPREYHALFSPDVVMGASLLLTLKHSADYN
ncbi:hypothetical protein BD311DRAFT_773763 [Dichomitus squalens]|uniref:Homeobox domain-containing protein n=1 Tax=Dichomitus squalens TaxID=114155 RepID=A0A4Q9N5Z6_9APHY|nr:hypothetical protein BD311DRAFT_773763 [Dichomitus squalens]